MVELVRAVRTPDDTCGSRAGHAAGEGVRGEPVCGYRRVTRAGGPAPPDSEGLPLPASPTDTRHRASFISVPSLIAWPQSGAGDVAGCLTPVGEDA